MNQKEIKGPRKVNTHAMIGKRKEGKTQKNKAPGSQTSQATCQTKEIDRAHRSLSTREAKQNKTNKKNQGSPIKTIKSHDSILVPLLGRGVFTAGFAPARPFPTPTYKCVGGSRSRKSRLVARRRLASSSSLCREVMNFSAILLCTTLFLVVFGCGMYYTVFVFVKVFFGIPSWRLIF